MRSNLLAIAPLFVLLASATAGAQQDILVPTGSTWRFLDNGTDQGATGWETPGFDENTWPPGSGPAELGYGAAKKGSQKLTNRVEAVLDRLDVRPFESPADSAYGLLRVRLEAAGRPIGNNDLLIASQSITLGYTIVTANLREFDRIDGLVCENWLR